MDGLMGKGLMEKLLPVLVQMWHTQHTDDDIVVMSKLKAFFVK